MLAFWDSVADLRRIDFITLLAIMVLPLLGGTLLLSVRHRLKILQTRSGQSQEFSHHETVQKLETQNQRLKMDIETSRRELGTLRHASAPRHFTELEENALVEKLRGVKASPVIVSAYAFEEESAAYAAQIAAALRKAGWQTTVNKASMNDFKGVSLGTVSVMGRPLDGLRTLADALTAAHVDLHQRTIAPDSIAGALEDESLLIVVGRK